MSDSTQIYACEYEVNGYMFSMHICGTHKEATTHAYNLGLGEPELVHAIIQEQLNNRLN